MRRADVQIIVAHREQMERDEERAQEAEGTPPPPAPCGRTQCAQCQDLRAQRDALVAALKNWQNFDLPLADRQNAARAAIAKAEGPMPERKA